MRLPRLRETWRVNAAAPFLCPLLEPVRPTAHGPRPTTADRGPSPRVGIFLGREGSRLPRDAVTYDVTLSADSTLSGRTHTLRSSRPSAPTARHESTI
jgi:hypothetical protein